MKELDLNLNEMRQQATAELFAALRAGLKRFDDIEALERLLNGQAVLNGSRSNGQTASVSDAAPVKKGQKKRQKNAPRTDRAKLAELALPYIQRHPGATTQDVLEFLRRTGAVPVEMKAQPAEQTVRKALVRSPRFRYARTPDKIGTPFRWYVRTKGGYVRTRGAPNSTSDAGAEKDTSPTTPTSLRQDIINVLLRAPRQGMTRREISVALGRAEQSDPPLQWRLQGLLKKRQAQRAGIRQNGRYTLIKQPFVVTKQVGRMEKK